MSDWEEFKYWLRTDLPGFMILIVALIMLVWTAAGLVRGLGWG